MVDEDGADVGLYEGGRLAKGEGCYGYVQVKDEGVRINVQYSGRNNLNEEKISLKFSVPAN